MPLLGFGHILTLVVQPAVASIGVPLVQQISDCVEAVIASAQGLVISLPYCFLNSEVQGVLASHWKRWRMVRAVGRSSPQINTSTYFVNQKFSDQVCYISTSSYTAKYPFNQILVTNLKDWICDNLTIVFFVVKNILWSDASYGHK